MSKKCVGCPNHNHNLQPSAQSEKPSKSPTAKHILGWSHILMTPSHSSRCGNTLYMYKVDLI
jgi:hypothetical protein